MNGPIGMFRPLGGEPCSSERSSGSRRSSAGGVDAVALFPPIHVNAASKKPGPRGPPRNKMALYESVTSGKRPHSLMGPPSSTLSGGPSGRQPSDRPQGSSFLPSAVSYESSLPYLPYQAHPPRAQQQPPYMGNGKMAVLGPVLWGMPPLYEAAQYQQSKLSSGSCSMPEPRGRRQQQQQPEQALGKFSSPGDSGVQVGGGGGGSRDGSKKKARRSAASPVPEEEEEEDTVCGESAMRAAGPERGGGGTGDVGSDRMLQQPLQCVPEVKEAPGMELGCGNEAEFLAFRAWRRRRQQQQQQQHTAADSLLTEPMGVLPPSTDATRGSCRPVPPAMEEDGAASPTAESLACASEGGQRGRAEGGKVFEPSLRNGDGGAGAGSSASDEGGLSEQLPAPAREDEEEEEGGRCEEGGARGGDCGNNDHNDDDDDDDGDVDSLRHPIVTAMDVVAVVGQLEFWKSRKAILRQQRIFSGQVFELHRLVKVQEELMRGATSLPPHAPEDGAEAEEQCAARNPTLATPHKAPTTLQKLPVVSGAPLSSHPQPPLAMHPGASAAAAVAAAEANAFTAEALALAAYRVGEEALRLIAQKEQMERSEGSSRHHAPRGWHPPLSPPGAHAGQQWGSASCADVDVGFWPAPAAVAPAASWFAAPPAVPFPALAAISYLPYGQMTSGQFQPSSSHQSSSGGGLYGGLYPPHAIEAAVPAAISLGMSSMEAGSRAAGGGLYPAYAQLAWRYGGQQVEDYRSQSCSSAGGPGRQHPAGWLQASGHEALAASGPGGSQVWSGAAAGSRGSPDASTRRAARVGSMKVVQRRSPFAADGGRASHEDASWQGSEVEGGSAYASLAGGSVKRGEALRLQQLQQQQQQQQQHQQQQQQQQMLSWTRAPYTAYREQSTAAAASAAASEGTQLRYMREAMPLMGPNAVEGGAAAAAAEEGNNDEDEEEEESGAGFSKQEVGRFGRRERGASVELSLFPTRATLSDYGATGHGVANPQLETRGRGTGISPVVIKAVPRRVTATSDSTAQILRAIQRQRMM